MDRIGFGASGIETSVAGLGCGGYSRLGAGNQLSAGNAIGIVHAAIDLGITFIDTSPSYENEALVGEAIRGRRDRVTLSTKFSTLNKEGAPIDGPALRGSLERSLARLGTDHVDVYSIQSVTPATYDHCRDVLLPTLRDLKAEGLVRAFGLTEWFFDDTAHAMATRAVNDGCWDYLLIGFNILNQSAARHVLPRAAERGMVSAIMFAVRRALSDREGLRRLVGRLVADGALDPREIDPERPLDFLLEDGDCASITEAAYRFCRHEAPNSVILTGTGDRRHLEENARAIGKGPLPPEHVARLKRIFGALDTLTGQEVVDADGTLAKRHVAGKPKGD